MKNSFFIFLTEAAEKHLKKLTPDNSHIHLSLKDSGCSGYAYVVNICANDNNQKYKIFNGLTFFIPEEQEDYLNNCIIDYKKEGLNYKLSFDNPNTENECGCGESFAIKKNKGVTV